MKNERFVSKVLRFDNFFYLMSCLLFSILFLFISFNNRLVPGDDYIFYYETIEKGVLQPLFDFDFNTRFSSFLIFNLIFSSAADIKDLPFYIFSYHLGFFILWSFSVFFLLKTVLIDFFTVKVSFKEIFLHSLLFNLGLFFFVPDFIETWYWVIGSTVYGIPIIASFFGLSALLNKTSGIFNISILVISSFIIGGALETLAICHLFILILIFLNRKVFYSIDKIGLKCLLSMLFILLMISINIFSGANTERVIHESTKFANPELFMNGNDFISSIFDSNNIISVLIMVSFFLFGLKLKDKNGTIFNINLKKLIWYNILGLSIIFVVTIVPMFLVFDSWGVRRAWLPFHFYFFISLIFWSLYFGNNSRYFSNVLLVKTVTGISITFILLMICFRQFPSLSAYSKVHDDMIKEVEQRKINGKSECMQIKPFPEPGYLVKYTIERDSLSSHNLLIKKVFKTNFYLQGTE